MRTLNGLLLCLTLLLTGCGGDDDRDRVVVTYSGDMYADFTPGQVEGDATDRIVMTIEEGKRYSILNLTKNTRGMFPPICDSEGAFRTVTQDTLQLEPLTVVNSGDCSTRVPNGLFVQIRTGQADSLVFESVAGATTLFRVNLRRVLISENGGLTGP